MAILLTGGTGKTSHHLSSLLHSSHHPFLLASRNPPKTSSQSTPTPPHIPFDWLNPSTYTLPFTHTLPNNEKISAVYIIAPPVENPSSYVSEFVDVAVKQGVRRFVVLTGSSDAKGQEGFLGGTWEHLEELRGVGVEYTVLRPTWFMENLSEAQYVASIRDEGKIYTACGDGKVPFVSAKDIAVTAYHGLVDPKPLPSDLRVLGPELLTYDEVAETMSNVLGREIVHVRLSREEVVERYKAMGLPEGLAQFLAHIEVATSQGAEERMNDHVEKATGRPPQKFEDWVLENKAVWE